MSKPRKSAAQPAIHETPSAPESEAIQLIGQKIRSLRKEKRLSLTTLAEQTGFSIGFLSQVERDISTLSVKALFDLSRALDVNVTYFFDANEQNERRTGPVIRPQERRKISFRDGIVDELLSPRACSDLEMLWTCFPPGSSSGEHGIDHTGQEAGVIITGILELTIGEDIYLLRAGDSYGFESTKPHRFRNPGNTDTIVVCAITPPSY